MRIAIIGANGFLGKHLCHLCRRLGHSVTAVILPNTPIAGLEGAEIVFADHTHIATFTRIFRQVQIVINAAGNLTGAIPQRYQVANIDLVSSLCHALEAVETPPRLIHLSSVAVTGPTTPEFPLPETTDCRPISLYGRSKQCGEAILQKHKGRFPFIILRLCSVYGPGDPNFLGLFRLARHGWFARFFTPERRFQLTYIDDFLTVFRQILTHPFPVAVVNLGDPHPISDQDLQEALGATFETSLRTWFIPPSLSRLIGRAGDILEVLTGTPAMLSTSKLAELAHSCWLHDMSLQEAFFSGAPFTPLADGLLRTRRWYEMNEWL
jgi:nucleoside-diphosphate-sugar epimerase